MKVEVNITRADLLKMNYYTFFKVRANYILFAILLISFGVGAQNLIAIGGVHIWLLTIFLLAVVMCFVFFTIGVAINVLLASVEKGFLGPTVYNLSEEFFEESTTGTDTKTKWASISSVYKFRNYMFVRINGYRVHVVPKREFINDQEFEKFCSMVIEKVVNT